MLAELGKIARLFFKLGTISFGGPAVHIALMEEEVVARRKWVSHEQFLDLLGATYLIPGPNAIEMAAHLGYRRAGLLGSLVGDLCFTLPAAAISGLLGWAYVRFGTLPEVGPFLRGIKPVVPAIIFAALFRLAKTALAGWQLVIIGLAVAIASLVGAGEILPLVVGGVLGAVFLWLTGKGRPPDRAAAAPGVGAAFLLATGNAHFGPLAAAGALGAVVGAVSLGKLALFFLKIGAVLYGSGYILVAYLQGGLVHDSGWLTEQQLLDAVAVGQITPGPLISTASFVGFLLLGAPGAAVATAAIVLPSFVFVALTNPWIAHLRRWRWTALFLDAISAASVGLTAAVTLTLTLAIVFPEGTSLDWQSGFAEIAATLVRSIDWQSASIAVAAVLVMLRWRPSPAWLILGGAVVGRLLAML